MKRIYIIFLVACVIVQINAIAQGCVAIKGTAGICGRPSDAKGWEMNLTNRYFKSYKHFVGTIEQKERVEKGTEVINHAYELDITATRTLLLFPGLRQAQPCCSCLWAWRSCLL